MYNLEAMKPLVQRQLSRYISENENIEKQNNCFVCKTLGTVMLLMQSFSL